MEIGGYFGLEQLGGQSYYPDLYALNLGRTALTYLLKALKCKTLFVPCFLCDSVTDKCLQEGFNLTEYTLDQDMNPQLETPPGEGEYLYLVNYYGQLTDQKIQNFKQKYSRIIVDHTHSFFQRPLKGIPTLYSCRKFFGVSDGAYLSTDLAMPAIAKQDISKDRMGHILGRFEGTASEYYQLLHQHARAFYAEPVKRMSLLTENILNAVNYEKVRSRRNQNYALLKKRLSEQNPLNFITPDAPLAYPFFHPDGIRLRKAMAQKQIYIPVYWNNVINSMPEDSIEYQYAANILALPCDQRYGSREMNTVADMLLTLLQGNGELCT